jgi:hypothetical protein
MIFSNQSGKRCDPDPLLSRNIATIGIREIEIWEEMVLQDESLFKEVYNLIYCDNPRIAWHAAWIIDHASETDPGKLETYIPELIERLPFEKSSALKRHFTRMLIGQKIPENQLGRLIDVLYNLLSPAEAIAVRANALQLLLNIALAETELQSELIIVTEAILEEELTPGMLSKAKRVLQTLKRQ